MANRIRQRLVWTLIAVTYSALSIWLIIALVSTLDDTQLQMREMSRSFVSDIRNTNSEFNEFQRLMTTTLKDPSNSNIKLAINKQQQLASRATLLRRSLNRLQAPDVVRKIYIEELKLYDDLVARLGKTLLRSPLNLMIATAEVTELMQQLEYSVAYLNTEGSELVNQQANRQIKIVKNLSTILTVLAAGVLIMFAGLTLALRKVYQQKTVLQKLSTEDGLTSLKNRRHFNEIFASEFARAKRTNGLLNLLMLDVDQFKKFNDTYGHAQGDDALIRVSVVMNQCMKRPQDWAFRLGGEEFACLMVTQTEADGLKMAETIRTEIQNLSIPHSANTATSVLTVSIGIAQLPDSAIKTEDDLYQAADKALYEAKASGRNRVAAFEKTDD